MGTISQKSHSPEHWTMRSRRALRTFAFTTPPPIRFQGMGAYGFSVLCCMSSALSEPGGLGLGTLGLPEPVARKMTAEAGFTRFTTRDFDNPINAYYEVRP